MVRIPIILWLPREKTQEISCSLIPPWLSLCLAVRDHCRGCGVKEVRLWSSYILTEFQDGWLCRQICLSLEEQICRSSLVGLQEALRGAILSNVIYLVYAIHSPHSKRQLPDGYWLFQESPIGTGEEKWQLQLWLISGMMGKSKPIILITVLTTPTFNNSRFDVSEAAALRQ